MQSKCTANAHCFGIADVWRKLAVCLRYIGPCNAERAADVRVPKSDG